MMNRKNDLLEEKGIGLADVKTICSFCGKGFHGHRDEGREWFLHHVKMCQAKRIIRKKKKGRR